MFKELKFDYQGISLDKQLVKVQEEIGELIKAVAGKDGIIPDEMGDVIISVYGLSVILGLDYNQCVKNGIKKVNNRILYPNK